MTLSSLLAIPLDDAWFCQSCRAVVNTPTCCLCASADHTHRLTAWLDREPPITIQQGGMVVSIYPAQKTAPAPLEAREEASQ